jgi:geranylgeranyl pyrophosphate synthase
MPSAPDLPALRNLLRSVLAGPAGPGRALPAAARRWIAEGQLLRARLLVRMAAARKVPARRWRPAAAALELVHAASLVHDDVIDGGLLRRHAPALWTLYGPRVAILAGDSLLATAFTLLAGTADIPALLDLLGAARGICSAEMARELVPPGRAPKPPRKSRLLALARGKTGPLFAFAAAWALPGDAADPRRAWWKNLGADIGLLYQMADDLADATAPAAATGKTMGRDAARRLSTCASCCTPAELDSRLFRLRSSILRSSVPSAPERDAVLAYLDADLRPALRPLA